MISALLISIVFITAGMLPTMISFFVVRRAGNRGSTCILLFNLAGLLPVLDRVWSASGGASSVVSDIFAWYVIYMVAAVGVAIVWFSSHIANLFLTMFAGRRRTIMKTRQEELYKEWGSSIVGD